MKGKKIICLSIYLLLIIIIIDYDYFLSGCTGAYFKQLIIVTIQAYRVRQQKTDTQNFNSKETFKNQVNSLIIHFKMFPFLTCFGHETAIAEVLVR